MKNRISNAVQVIAAILITGGLVASAAPLPQASITPEVPTEQIVVTEVKKEVPVEPTPVVVAPTPAVTWESNPQNCDQNKQYISKDAPFNCIDKPSTSPVASSQPVSAPSGGSCDEWIAAAGIDDVASARELIRRESGCNPNAINPSSGACGVAQELPCGKSGCSLGDGACQVKWMNGYVKARYKSWGGAIIWHNNHNWY